MKDTEITGVMVQYYQTCKRELWFYIHQINMNYDNDDIDIGKLIHNSSYKREKKEIRQGNMVFDFVQDKDKLRIFEIKKSSKLIVGAEYQLCFYLYNLYKANIKAEGILVYPKEKKREKIYLTNNKIQEIENIIEGIKEISSKNTPPKQINKPYCKRCSFYELCKI